MQDPVVTFRQVLETIHVDVSGLGFTIESGNASSVMDIGIDDAESDTPTPKEFPPESLVNTVRIKYNLIEEDRGRTDKVIGVDCWIPEGCVSVTARRPEAWPEWLRDLVAKHHPKR